MTTTVSPLTPEAHAVEQLADIISRLGAFQEACGATSDEEARRFIFEGWQATDGTPLKCCAIIYELAGEPSKKLADGVTMPAGQLLLDLWLNVDTPDDSQAEYRRVKNFHGAIARAINNYYGAGYVMRATASGPPQREHPAHVAAVDADKGFWFIQYTVRWDPFGQ